MNRIFSLIIQIMIVMFCVIGCEEKADVTHDTSAQEKLIPEKYDSLHNVSAFDPNVIPKYRLSLVKETEYGDSKDFFMGTIIQFAVDDFGRVYTVTGRQIEVFDKHGKHLTTLGRDGRGPGEFNNMTFLKPKVSTRFLYAYDDVLDRVNVFSIDSLTYSHAILLDRKQIAHTPGLSKALVRDVTAIHDSLFSVEFDIYGNYSNGERGKRKFFSVNLDGELIDSLFSYTKHINRTGLIIRSGEKSVQFPFTNPSDSFMKVVFDDEHNIYASTGEDFLISVYDVRGTYVRSIYYPFKHRNFDKEPIIEKNSFNKTRMKRAREFEYPKVWPAIDEFFVDDEGRIWVATIIDDDEHYEWWVLENTGELITKFAWPGKRLDRDNSFRSRPIVKNGYFYVREEDENTGVRKIIRYKIELEKVGD